MFDHEVSRYLVYHRLGIYSMLTTKSAYGKMNWWKRALSYQSSLNPCQYHLSQHYVKSKTAKTKRQKRHNENYAVFAI